jgi:hypothetical protein
LLGLHLLPKEGGNIFVAISPEFSLLPPSSNYWLGLLFYPEDGGDIFLRVVGPFQKVSLLTTSVGMLLQSSGLKMMAKCCLEKLSFLRNARRYNPEN